MHFVDGHRRAVASCARRACASSRCRSTGSRDPRRLRRSVAAFRAAGPGVGLVDAIAVATRLDVELVERPLEYARNESFPDARRTARTQNMGLRCPFIEAAHNGDGTRVWGPDAEHRTGLAIVRDEMSSHLFVKAIVAALVEEVEILVGEELRDGERSFRAHGGALDSLPEPAKGWPQFMRISKSADSLRIGREIDAGSLFRFRAASSS